MKKWEDHQRNEGTNSITGRYYDLVTHILMSNR
jgi:hypothetical protein